jgi:hypothetical protein
MKPESGLMATWMQFRFFSKTLKQNTHMQFIVVINNPELSASANRKNPLVQVPETATRDCHIIFLTDKNKNGVNLYLGCRTLRDLFKNNWTSTFHEVDFDKSLNDILVEIDEIICELSAKH